MRRSVSLLSFTRAFSLCRTLFLSVVLKIVAVIKRFTFCLICAHCNKRLRQRTCAAHTAKLCQLFFGLFLPLPPSLCFSLEFLIAFIKAASAAAAAAEADGEKEGEEEAEEEE